MSAVAYSHSFSMSYDGDGDMRPIATATFLDSYAGRVLVQLVPVGRNGRAVWTGIDACVSCGYRTLPAMRALAVARRDHRFADVAMTA